MASSQLYWFALFVFASCSSGKVATAGLVLEDGYTVTTVLDGHKVNINPYSVHPRPGSSDLVAMDSSGSAFYAVVLPTEGRESVIKRFSGDGDGFLDGDLGSARFNKPRSFAMDLKGNVYVADRKNYAIRKISSSGVSTIAGGISQKTGSMDGPAQNATFSTDFEVVFVPERCALLISDHGNQLVRKIDLKMEDCARGSQSVLGVTSLWILALGVSCLLGVVIGFVARPYIMSTEGSSPMRLSKTWRLCLINLGTQALICFFGIRSAIVNLTLFAVLRRLFWMSISHLSLMFRTCLFESRNSRVKYDAPVLDARGVGGCRITKPLAFADQLGDLILFDGGPEPEPSNLTEGNVGRGDESQGSGRIDNLIQANITGFAARADKTDPINGSLPVGGSGLLKRR